MLADTGQVFYQDDYGQLYLSEWHKVDSVYDFTTTIKQPFVWGAEAAGYLRDGVVYRRGIITVHRQIMSYVDGGYEILAEGVSQYIDYYATTFRCVVGPADNFLHHFDHLLTEQELLLATSGPRWADPDSDADDNALWAIVESDGSIADPGTTGIDHFAFIDVWSF